MEEIRRWAATEHGVNVPLPNEASDYQEKAWYNKNAKIRESQYYPPLRICGGSRVPGKGGRILIFLRQKHEIRKRKFHHGTQSKNNQINSQICHWNHILIIQLYKMLSQIQKKMVILMIQNKHLKTYLFWQTIFSGLSNLLFIRTTVPWKFVLMPASLGQ